MNSLPETFGILNYPEIGPEDWRYTFAAAQARSMNTFSLPVSILTDMANARDFKAALELLSGTYYQVSSGINNLKELEDVLIARRDYIRDTFEKLCVDDELSGYCRTLTDFTNLRLVLRRIATDKPAGKDYASGGNIAPDNFEPIFEQEDLFELNEHVKQASENAILAYYEDRDIKRIDNTIDAATAQYQLDLAVRIKSVFLMSLTRMKIDIDNIRTLLRQKAADTLDESLFIKNGFVDSDLYKHALNVSEDQFASIFMPTPYERLVEKGVEYYSKNDSFNLLEALCEGHINAFLEEAMLVTAGEQPLIAWLLKQQQEIRYVRMILTAKRNMLDSETILERLGQKND
jgi:V/A-type H+/Na+-transporting ATPase subunit C